MVIVRIFGGFEFPGTEKKVAGKRIYRGESTVAGTFPPSAIWSNGNGKVKSSFLGPVVKKKCPMHTQIGKPHPSLIAGLAT